MEKLKLMLDTEALLFEYVCMKVKNNLGSSVYAEEFKEFTNQLLEHVSNARRNYEFYLDDKDFHTICINTIHHLEMNQPDKMELTYDGKLLRATYDLTSKDLLKNMSAKAYLKRYFSEKVAYTKRKPYYFDALHLDAETEKTAKRIASYLLDYLMRQYIALNVAERKWPKQCQDPYKYIFEKDLASIIGLPGTKLEFLNVYINAIKFIGTLLVDGEYFEISNDPKHCLAFANFNQIVAPYEGVNMCLRGVEDDIIKNELFSIIVENGKITFRKYDKLDSKHVNSILSYSDAELESEPHQFVEDYLNSGTGAIILESRRGRFIS